MTVRGWNCPAAPGRNSPVNETGPCEHPVDAAITLPASMSSVTHSRLPSFGWFTRAAPVEPAGQDRTHTLVVYR